LVHLDGTLGGPPWELPKKTSNVLLLDAEGKLIFRHSGRMKEEEMEAFFGTLGRLIGVDMGGEKQP
jgi:predicted transcriptional regulator